MKNFTEKMKRFWSLQKKTNSGFTLVELIVVIAILAILAGIAVPAYSGYVEKANKQADRTLVSEVENAIQLAYYSDPNFVPGSVILSVNESKPVICDNESLENAMSKAFGANWRDLRLKYEWENNASLELAETYRDSSYSGNEQALLNEVGKLTNILSDAISTDFSLVGSSFSSYLANNNLADADTQTIANAAVLYAANVMADEDTDEVAIAEYFDEYYEEIISSGGTKFDVGNLTIGLREELGTFGACAALYAHAEAFCQYASNEDPTLLEDFHNATLDVQGKSTDEILSVIGDAFEDILNRAKTLECGMPYVLGEYEGDVDAYMAILKAINENSEVFKENLSKEECYTDENMAGLLMGYLAACDADITDGQVAVSAILLSDDSFKTVVVPLELSKQN